MQAVAAQQNPVARPYVLHKRFGHCRRLISHKTGQSASGGMAVCLFLRKFALLNQNFRNVMVARHPAHVFFIPRQKVPPAVSQIDKNGAAAHQPAGAKRRAEAKIAVPVARIVNTVADTETCSKSSSAARERGLRPPAPAPRPRSCRAVPAGSYPTSLLPRPVRPCRPTRQKNCAPESKPPRPDWLCGVCRYPKCCPSGNYT